jgi:RecT family
VSDKPCLWRWKDNTRTIIECTVHSNERKVIRPDEKEEVEQVLRDIGEWADADTPAPASSPATQPPSPPAAPPQQTALTPTVQQGGQEVVAYTSIAGTRIHLTIEGFQTLLCKMANKQQAQFMIAWCQHNRIDPFSNEAHFSIIDNQPVIQVSKDAWFKRMEAHADFAGHDSGILIRTSREALTTAALLENDDYLMSPAMKDALLNPKTKLPEQLTVKKRGQFVDEGEELIGGWCTIQKKSRPAPIIFQIPLKGWEQQKRNNEPNVFWDRKPSFMIWKSALKNGARLAFPDLSGMLGVPEYDEDGTGEEARLLTVPKADQWYKEEQRKALLGTLHAAGAEVPPPAGPWNHLALHNLAASLYGVDSLAALDVDALSEMCGQVTVAQTDEETARRLKTHIGDLPPEGERLKLPRKRTSDQMGVSK